MLTSAEEKIMEAAGLTAGLVNVKCFRSATNQPSAHSENDENNNSGIISELQSSDIEVALPTSSQSRRPKKKVEKKQSWL